MSSTPSDLPPSYEQSTGTSDKSKHNSSHLEVPGAKNGIPAQARKSMEDEHRPLPRGWIRQYDTKENHQFFVNTNTDPPQSHWEHPLDMPDVVKALSTEERERLQEEESRLRTHSADHSEDEHFPPELPERPAGSKVPQHSTAAASSTQKKSFGEKLKDKVTGSTHEEREQKRAVRAEEERQYYEAHQKLRRAMQQAQITGQPQFFAKDRDGKNIYIEPPG
jgi:hypothetical protein